MLVDLIVEADEMQLFEDLHAVDEQALVEGFLAALGRRSDAERISGLVLRQTGQVRVERRPPHAQASGKVLYVHLASADEQQRRRCRA